MEPYPFNMLNEQAEKLKMSPSVCLLKEFRRRFNDSVLEEIEMHRLLKLIPTKFLKAELKDRKANDSTKRD